MEGILIPQQVFVGDSAEFLFPIDDLKSFDPSILMSGSFKIDRIHIHKFYSMGNRLRIFSFLG